MYFCNLSVNNESVECIAIAYSEVRITEIGEQLSRVDQSGKVNLGNKDVYEDIGEKVT